jgi:tryptophan synthase alpha subunit
MSFDHSDVKKDFKDFMKYFQSSSSSATTDNMQLFTTIEERRRISSEERNWVEQKYIYGDYPAPEDVIRFSQEIKGLNADLVIVDDFSFEEHEEEKEEKELPSFDPKDLDI